ncbi:MAG: hypothetical protein IJS97_08435 [Prevotella sp.]|nr:hypothetical protein [Prevotella sp.]
MNKKRYIKPFAKVKEAMAEELLTKISATESLQGTTYGGTSYQGGTEADSRLYEHKSVWDD